MPRTGGVTNIQKGWASIIPFITQQERNDLKDITPTRYDLPTSRELTPGQRCYLYYKWMKDEWRRKPGWATVDEIFQIVDDPCFEGANHRARELAFRVFFNLVVMDYELTKQLINGDI